MTLIRWNPVLPTRRWDPLFSSFFRDWPEAESGARIITPAVDIRETDDEVVLSVELPGLAKEDVNITVEDGVLAISGERKFERQEGKEYHLQESWHGSFLRRFTLGDSVDENNVKAKMDKGVLEIVLGKKEEVKPKKIDIAIQ